MRVDKYHPDWVDRAPEWRRVRDAVRGRSAIIAGGVDYLPRPSGFGSHDDGGAAAYEDYQKRARYPSIVGPTVAGMAGTLHRIESLVTLPREMEFIYESATRDGLPIEALHSRITRELLTTARYTLQVGAPAEGGDPYLVGIPAESLINWSPERDFYIIDESGYVRNEFEWEMEQRYRVLRLEGGVYTSQVYTGEGHMPGILVTPRAKGGAAMSAIPLVTINALDVSLDLIDPPLIEVTEAAIAMYQLSADYRWQLFMSGQETLFIFNGEAPSVVGAGVVVELNGGGGGELQPDARYVGPSGTGIDAHRVAIQDEKDRAASAGARMLQQQSVAGESGEAKRLRMHSETASLVTVANASAKGLEHALRHMAVMIGITPERARTEVIVAPNLAFLDAELTTQDVLNIIKGWQEGGYSFVTMHEKLQRGGAVSYERTAEDEMKLLDREDTGADEVSDEDGALAM